MMRRAEVRISSEIQQSVSILVEQFPLDLPARREAPDIGQYLRSLATNPLAQRIVAISAEHQFVLVFFDKLFGVCFIAGEEVQARTRRHVAKHIRVIA
jgi:hypothetical protein